MTIRDQDSALASTLLPVLETYGLHHDPALIQDLVGAVSDHLARQIEETCRGAYPWPPVRRKGRWDRQEQQRGEGELTA